jgi:hypothetical protein
MIPAKQIFARTRTMFLFIFSHTTGTIQPWRGAKVDRWRKNQNNIVNTHEASVERNDFAINCFMIGNYKSI